jgi:hypothetical protein
MLLRRAFCECERLSLPRPNVLPKACCRGFATKLSAVPGRRVILFSAPCENALFPPRVSLFTVARARRLDTPRFPWLSLVGHALLLVAGARFVASGHVKKFGKCSLTTGTPLHRSCESLDWGLGRCPDTHAAMRAHATRATERAQRPQGEPGGARDVLRAGVLCNQRGRRGCVGYFPTSDRNFNASAGAALF